MSDIVPIKEDEFKISICKYYLPCGWCELKQKECVEYLEYFNYMKEKAEKIFVWSGTKGAKIE